MITTGSKYLYGLAAWLLFSGVVYGYVTGGDNVGPISLGYKGAVGDLLGYTLLMGGGIVVAFLGFFITALRDADPDAEAQVAGFDVPPAVAPTGVSYWPILGAFGVGLTVVGLALDNRFFVAGLILLGAVAIEWTMQAWADRATGDPATNKQIRNRIMYPLEIPILGALAILVVVGGVSRIFLTVSKENAVWVGCVVAGLIFLVGTILSTRPRIRTDLVAGILSVFAIAVIAGGIFGALNGEREFEHHGEEHAEEHGEDESHDEGAESGADDEPAEAGE